MSSEDPETQTQSSLPQSQYTDAGNDEPSEQQPLELSGSRSLKQAYINEKAAPELLQYAAALVADTQEGLTRQEALLEEWDSDREQDLVANILRCEMQRVRYLLRGYLRTRIRKIERHVMAILDDSEETQKLSAQERAYSLEYFRQFGRHMTTQLLDHLPKAFDGMARESSESDRKDMVDHPDLERHVFCRVLEDCGDIDAGEVTVPFKQGDQYVVSYQYIQQLLAADYVNLV